MKYDTNQIFREVTMRLTGEPAIEEAFRNTLNYLRDFLPLEEILIMGWEEEDQGSDSWLLRIDPNRASREDAFPMPEFNEDMVEARRNAFASLPSTFVRRFEDLPEPKMIEEVRYEKMAQLGFSKDASFLVLGVRDLHAAVAFVCDRADAYSDEDVALMDSIKEPFIIALGNAIHVYIAERSRDELRDGKEIFEQVTRRVTGKLDIGEALHDTLDYLKTIMPADEIILFRVDEQNRGFHLLVRVSEDGVIGEPDRLLFHMPEDVVKLNTPQCDQESMPEVFIPVIDELPPFEFSFDELQVPSDGSFIIINQLSLFAGLVIMSRQTGAYNEEHVRLLTMLKEPFVIALSNALRYYELRRLKDQLADDNRALLTEIRKAAGDRVVGADGGLRRTMTLVEQVARTNSPVLLLGETGSGKEVIATAVHRASDRASGPLVSLNCGAVPETLLDSELFGHEKGAFTGAMERKRGRFERADGGTLFLDEIGELPPSAQVKLLRVLQSKEFERVGGTQTIRSDVRLIAATHRDLPRMVREGNFREDLWFRLNVFPISIPPLRERREDIPTLAYHFIESKSREMNLGVRPPLPDAELHKLTAYDWPGNVRELQNAIERALILSRGRPLSFPLFGIGSTQSDTPRDGASPPICADTIQKLDAVVAQHLSLAVEVAGGRISGPGGAAELVGLNPSTFRSKLKKLGLVRVNRGEIHKAT